MSLLLGLSIVALFIGIFAFPLARRNSLILSALDGFVMISVGGLVLLHLAPDGIEGGGWLGVLAFVLGLFIPALFERFGPAHAHGHDPQHQHSHKLSPIIISVVVLGVGLHAVLDGAAISLSNVIGSDHESPLALAVLFHRLPVGFVIGTLFSVSVEKHEGECHDHDKQDHSYLPRLGSVVSGVVISVATIIGFVLGEKGLGELGESAVSIFEALVAGALLHVVFGHEVALPLKCHRFAGVGAGVGALLGAVPLIFMGEAHDHSHGHEQVREIVEHVGHVHMHVEDIFLNAAPALVLALLLIAIWPRHTANFKRGVMGAFAALPEDGESGGSSLFHDSRSLLGMEALWLTFAFFGPGALLVRFAAAAVVPFALTILNKSNAELMQPSHSWFARLVKSAEHAFPPFVLGMGVGALFFYYEIEPVNLPAWAQLFIVAAISWPLRLCSLAATGLGLAMLAFGFTPGALVVLWIVGPLCWYRQSVKRQLSVVLLGLAFGFLVNAIPVELFGFIGLSHLEGLWIEHVFEGAPVYEVICQVSIALCSICALWCLARGGVRPWLASLHLFGLDEGCTLVGHAHHSHSERTCPPHVPTAAPAAVHHEHHHH